MRALPPCSAELAASGVQIELRHCCSSGATILYPEFALDMVRPGIATYGLAPSADAAGVLDLRPIMSLHTSVAQIRDVPAGTDVSYGRTYTTEKPTRMAVLPIGYADGLSRAPVAGKVSFRIHGKGRWFPSSAGSAWTCAWSTFRKYRRRLRRRHRRRSSAMTTTGALIPCERLAAAQGTINYELLCQISERIPRICHRGTADIADFCNISSDFVQLFGESAAFSRTYRVRHRALPMPNLYIIPEVHRKEVFFIS